MENSNNSNNTPEELFEKIEEYCDSGDFDLVSELLNQEFGNFYFEDNFEKLVNIEPNRVWTELIVSNGDLFITNHFYRPGEIHDLNGWYVFQKPYPNGVERITITTVSWETCSCIEVDDEFLEDDLEPNEDCDKCNGNGTEPKYYFVPSDSPAN